MQMKLYDCDLGVVLNGVNYTIPHVDEVRYTDPEMKQLTRGANSDDSAGITYITGRKDPKTIEVDSLQIPVELASAFNTAYENETRMEVYAISRRTGSSVKGKQAILVQPPLQASINESPDSLVVTLQFNTFTLERDVKEND